MNSHGAKDVLEAGFGGQLVSMLDDLATQLSVVVLGLIE
jgi:hypothetical protein